MATEVLPKPSIKTATPWQVLVFDDPVNEMTYVTVVFMKVLQMSKEKAERHMMEVHETGKSIVWTGEREMAEHYAQQLQSYQLHSAAQRSE